MTASDPVNIRMEQWQRRALLVGIAGVLLVAAGGLLDGWAQFLRSYLFGYFYWLGMGLGCLGILLMHHTVGGKWGMMIRRMCEAGSRTVPYMIVFMIPILASMPTIYPWARPGALADPKIGGKAAYLNQPFVVVRAIFYFAVWAYYAWRLSKWSAEQDATGDRSLKAKMTKVSAPGVVVFTFVTSFAFMDWVMSIEPTWFSTVYGAMFIIGQMLESFGFMIALVIILSKWSPIKDYITKQHLHDLGNMMFAWMVLWAYLSFSQFLIIWSGNLPEEISWYLKRLKGGWGWVALAIVIFHFATPFVLLLMRGIKRHANRLLKVCVLMVVIRVVDTFWWIEPGFYNEQFHVHWLDLAMLVAFGGLWVAGFFWQLNRRSLLPMRDERLEGAPRETVAY